MKGEARSEATSVRLLVMLEGGKTLLLSLRSSRPSLLAPPHLNVGRCQRIVAKLEHRKVFVAFKELRGNLSHIPMLEAVSFKLLDLPIY